MIPAVSASAREVAALVPGAAGRPCHRGDHRDIGVRANGGTDFGDQRGDDAIAEIEIAAEIAVGRDVGAPERLGHIGGIVDVAVEIGADVGHDFRLEAARIDAGLLRAGDAMLAEAEAEHVLQPRVRLHQREFVMIAVSVGGEARRLERDAANRVALGDVPGEADGIGARVGRRGAEVVVVGIAEGVADDRVRMRHAEPRIVQQHQPDIDGHAAVVDQFAQNIALAEQPVGDRLYGAIARRIGVEIDRSVIGEIDLSGLAVRAHELAGVIAAGDRHRIEAEVAEFVCRGRDAGFRQIPGVGVNGLVAHRFPSLSGDDARDVRRE